MSQYLKQEHTWILDHTTNLTEEEKDMAHKFCKMNDEVERLKFIIHNEKEIARLVSQRPNFAEKLKEFKYFGVMSTDEYVNFVMKAEVEILKYTNFELCQLKSFFSSLFGLCASNCSTR